MRLAELDPHWIHAEGRERLGVRFQCPTCILGCGHGAGHRGHYIRVFFTNPLDGGAPASAETDPNPRWYRTGDTIETLSLSPSVNSGCWHGHVTNGEARPA